VRAIAGSAIAAALAGACHERTVDSRTHVLDALPSAAATLIVADGAALTADSTKPALAALRAFVPGELACVLDIAPTADAIGVAIGDTGDADGAVVAIVTASLPKPCPALSHYEADLWIGTLGAARPSQVAATSALGSPRWDRARPYLLDAPIAVATTRAIATARTSPLELWIAVDGEVDQPLAAVWREAKLDVAKHGAQVIARTPEQPPIDLAPIDLAALVTASLGVLTAPPAAPPPTFALECQPNPNIVACHGHQLVVRSVAAALRALADAADRTDPARVRLTADALGLRRGDVVLAIDARRIASPDQLRVPARTADTHVIAVRRGELDLAVDLRQQE
jgi:hypothetical protein